MRVVLLSTLCGFALASFGAGVSPANLKIENNKQSMVNSAKDIAASLAMDAKADGKLLHAKIEQVNKLNAEEAKEKLRAAKALSKINVLRRKSAHALERLKHVAHQTSVEEFKATQAKARALHLEKSASKVTIHTSKVLAHALESAKKLTKAAAQAQLKHTVIKKAEVAREMKKSVDNSAVHATDSKKTEKVVVHQVPRALHKASKGEKEESEEVVKDLHKAEKQDELKAKISRATVKVQELKTLKRALEPSEVTHKKPPALHKSSASAASTSAVALASAAALAVFLL